MRTKLLTVFSILAGGVLLISFQDKTLQDSIKRGEEAYSTNCVTCHMAKGEGLEGSFPPLAKADYITKLHAICMKCGNIANYSYRKIPNEDRIMLGEKNVYEARCRRCYNLDGAID